MRGQVVQHQHVARSYRWAQHLLYIGIEYFHIDRPLDAHRSLDSCQRQAGDERGLSAVVARHPLTDALTSRRTPVQPRHSQVNARLVNKAQAAHIQASDSAPVPGPLIVVALGGD